MPIQRDDADERIARLEKMMEEARAKPAGAAGPTTPQESVLAKAKITRPARPRIRKSASRR
jgi:hypothetical protein